jgi:hypothetical protein
MNEKLKKRLFGRVLAYLRSCAIADGRVDWAGPSDEMTKLVEFEEQHLHEWVSRYGLVMAVTADANQLVMDAKELLPDGNLSEAVGNDALEKLAGETADYFTTLPHEHEYWIHFRGITELDLTEPLQIGEMLTLEKAEIAEGKGGLFNALMEGGGGALTPGQTPRAPLQNGDTVLRVRVKGFSSHRISDSAPAAALSIAKEFFVLAETWGVLEHRGHIAADRLTGLVTQLPVKDYVWWMPGIQTHVLRHADGYSLNGRLRTRTAGLLGSNPDEQVPVEGKELREAVAARLRKLNSIFVDRPDAHATSLRTAAQWFFDARAEDNETSAFIYTSLGLEALLGDEKQPEGIGLMKLLANRLAYLAGGTREARERLIKKFENFYGIRSRIVHGRAPRLSYEDRQMLLVGQTWLHAAIHKELYHAGT